MTRPLRDPDPGVVTDIVEANINGRSFEIDDSAGPVRQLDVAVVLVAGEFEHAVFPASADDRRCRVRHYPERVNFRKEGGVNGARRAAAPDATVTSPT